MFNEVLPDWLYRVREFGDGYKKEPPTTTIATNAVARRSAT